MMTQWLRLEIEIGWYVAGPSSSFDFLALTCAEGAEVLGRLRDDVGTKLHDNAACRLSANGDVEVNLGVGPARRGNENKRCQFWTIAYATLPK